jgi:hypothetical protein
MSFRAIAILAVLAIAALTGCGGSDDESSVPGGADPDVVEVIRGWADELRAGDVEAAADRFEIPSTVQNGTPAIQLSNRDEVVAFNESLPCGAELTEAEQSGEFTIATFELTERPGPGECGTGVGETAKTAFVIHEGRIAEWRRVVDADEAAQPSEGPVV